MARKRCDICTASKAHFAWGLLGHTRPGKCYNSPCAEVVSEAISDVQKGRGVTLTPLTPFRPSGNETMLRKYLMDCPGAFKHCPGLGRGLAMPLLLDSVVILHLQHYMRCHAHAGRRDACAEYVPRMYFDELAC